MGRPTDTKHRDATFHQLSAEVLREAVDPRTLEFVTTRVLNHPDVRQDPELAAMLRGFLSERAGIVRAEQSERDQVLTDSLTGHTLSTDHAQPIAVSRAMAGPTAAQVRDAFARSRHEFDERLMHFDIGAAQAALGRLEELQSRYPAWLDGSITRRLREDAERLAQRVRHFREQIDALERAVLEGARAGDHERAAAALQRLSSIHVTRPYLLGDREYQKIRDALVHVSTEQETRQAGQELVARERAVIDELKQLAQTIHEFHVVALHAAHDDPAYQRAETTYLTAIREIRSHDNEWLAGLILELETLIEDLHDPTGRALVQLDRFLDAVRNGLSRIRHEITEIQIERSPSHPTDRNVR